MEREDGGVGSLSDSKLRSMLLQDDAGNEKREGIKLKSVTERSCLVDHVNIKHNKHSSGIDVNSSSEQLVEDIMSESHILVSPKNLISPSFLETQLISSVPEAVATEMVVTTTEALQQIPDLDAAENEVTDKADIHENSAVLVQDVVSEQMPVVWASLVDGRVHSAEESSENELLNTSQESFVALMPSTNCESAQKEMVLLKQHESSIREITKRERDRMKKRVLRTDANFREREKIQAKERMRNKRSDPLYREQEREKDRIRRRLARQRNLAARDNERERDRSYKRNQRNNFLGGNNILTQVEVVDESLCSAELICESNIDPGQHLSMEAAAELDTGASVEI